MTDALLAFLDPAPEPHPAFVAAQVPTAAELTMAAARFGWLPDPAEPWLRPALPGRRPAGG